MRRAASWLALGLACLGFPAHAQDARIVHWVENAPADDINNIALGYPVPLPVDTPLPFDGFRSYAGLHARHQDLANSTPWVHPVNVGTTRAGRTIWAYRVGDSDLLTRETWQQMGSRGPRAKLAEIPGVGHAPMFLADDQIAVARDFLLAA